MGPAPWERKRSCMSLRCRSSSSRRRSCASAARSGGSTATMLSSMSASTCCRSMAGSDEMKPAGSRFWSGIGGALVLTARRACSARCWANTWAQTKQCTQQATHNQLSTTPGGRLDFTYIKAISITKINHFQIWHKICFPPCIICWW